MTDNWATKAAHAGAEWLDEHQPGWFNKVDIDKLDLADGQFCVLGQMHGSESYASYWHELKELGFDNSSAALSSYTYGDLTPSMLGFNRGGPESTGDSLQDYELLTEAWIGEITTRRQRSQLRKYLVEVAHLAFGGSREPIVAALVEAESPSAAMEDMFRLTNTIHDPWYENTEVFFVFRTEGQRQLAERGGLRSTSVGDLMWVTPAGKESTPLEYRVAGVGFVTADTPMSALDRAFTGIRE